jgi:N-acyl-D-amino-acid deacylase
MHDILIRGGTLFDGAGNPGVAGEDVAIADGRIAAIGKNLAAGARKTIDAAGLAVAPGFIDIKTHSDLKLPVNPNHHPAVFKLADQSDSRLYC